MPIYCYRAESGEVFEAFLPLTDHTPTEMTFDPDTGEQLPEGRPGVRAVRSLKDEGRDKDRYGRGYQPVYGKWPIYAASAGVPPRQIAARMRRFPHHEYTPRGRMVWHNPQHKKRCLRDVTMVDFDVDPDTEPFIR